MALLAGRKEIVSFTGPAGTMPTSPAFWCWPPSRNRAGWRPSGGSSTNTSSGLSLIPRGRFGHLRFAER
jgi:hypothetical protein